MMLSYQKRLLISSAKYYFQNIKAELCVLLYIFTGLNITSGLVLY